MKTNLYKSSSGDEIPERDVTYHLISLLIYHQTTTHLSCSIVYIYGMWPVNSMDLGSIVWHTGIVLRNIFEVKSTYLMDVGLWKAPCVFCYYPLVPSINYSLVCSLPIHTRSSTNAKGPRAHCQSKSCKMLHKCSTNCIWKGLQAVNDLLGHSRSLPLLAFDWPYTISY